MTDLQSPPDSNEAVCPGSASATRLRRLTTSWIAERPAPVVAGLALAVWLCGAQRASSQQPETGLPPPAVTQVPTTGPGSLRSVAAMQPLGLLIPDSEFVYGPTLYGFDSARFVAAQTGFLASYAEVVAGQTLGGAEIIDRLSRELSLGPRLLLTLIEMHSGWVTNPQPANALYPLPEPVPGLDAALRMAAGNLLASYYGYRSGGEPSVQLADGSRVMTGNLNAGSLALLSYLSRAEGPQTLAALTGPSRFVITWTALFGDPYFYDISETLSPAPAISLELPFAPGEMWFYVSGPRTATGPHGPLAAVEFAPPPANSSDCGPSPAWVLAAAAGQVVRSDDRQLVIDLDGDGFEGSGWVHIYRHLSPIERLTQGKRVRKGDPIGHPSCEGSSGPPARVGFARRYNGEWIAAADPKHPLLLGGWLAVPGQGPGEGYLIHARAPSLTASNDKNPAANGVVVIGDGP